MGLTVLEIEIGCPSNPEVRKKLEFLIDSGAIYSVVAAQILERLGTKLLSEQKFRLDDGSKIVRKKGIALFKYQDKVGGADPIFGEEGDRILLGGFTLEALGLALDPPALSQNAIFGIRIVLQRWEPPDYPRAHNHR